MLAPNPVAAQIKTLPAGAVGITFDGLKHDPYPYQRNDIAWMLAQRQGIVGHDVGVGKTIMAISMLQYLKVRGRLEGAVVLMPKQAGVLPQQWLDEFGEWAPGLDVTLVAGGIDRAHRRRIYRDPTWDVLLINYELARNDSSALREDLAARPVNVLYADEASMFKTYGSKTAQLMRRISGLFEYRFAVTGTAIQRSVEDLHSICHGIGRPDLVGTQAWFRRTYLIREKVTYWTRDRHNRPVERSKTVTTGFQNIGQLRTTLEPWFIRRTADDPEVARYLPAVQSHVVRVPMTAAQERAYKAARKGAIAELASSGVRVRYVDAQRRYVALLGMADGTATVTPEARDHSAKSDWLMDRLQTGWEHEKVVVFSRFVRSIRPLQARLEQAGIGYSLFLGGDHMTDRQRREHLRRFQEDPDCRVLVGTQAMEMGLNLQVARIMVFYSMLPNPKRMEQILGRVRRGQQHRSVIAVTLLTEGTLEPAAYEAMLELNAVADFFWQDESMLFERLGAERLMQLIRS